MTVDTSFMKRRREQQVKYERSVLRELSLDKLKKGFQKYFGNISSQGGHMLDSAIEEGCFDVAVEAYLTGSRYSRVGYYGEDTEKVMERSKERDDLTQALAEFITYWSSMNDTGKVNESLLYKCEQYIDYWWQEGFIKGKLKYKMKLH